MEEFIKNKDPISHIKGENLTLNKISNSIFIGDFEKRYIYYNDTFFNSNILQRNNKRKIKYENLEIIESFENIFIFTEQYGDKNIFHWINEYAPNFFFLFDLIKILPNIKIIVNKNARLSKNIKQLLLLIPEMKESNIYEFDFNKRCIGIKANNLFIGDDTGRKDGGSPNIINIWKKIRPIIKIKAINKSLLPKNIYVSRRQTPKPGNGRILINTDEISEYIIKKGYTEVFMENLSIEEKIHLFENCDKIICELGAGIANFFMCKKSVDCIILLQNNIQNRNFFKYSMSPFIMSLAARSRHTLVFGKTISQNHNGNPICTPWKLDLKDLQKFI